MSTFFRKSDMLDELRTILLFEGDHLILGRGPEFAETFLGFPPEDGSNYCDDDPARVDLGLFPIATSFDRGYDYAFAPSNPIQIDESEVQDLIVFMDGVPRIGGTSMGGTLHDFMTPKGLCRRVADTVFARWKLEIEKADEFSIREMALLANMTEGAVRNAISVGDLKTVKRGTATLVEHEHALGWLRGRKGFVPMPQREDKGGPADALRSARTSADFAAALETALFATSLPDLDRLVGWSEKDRRRWIAGDAVRDFRAISALGRVLGIPEQELFETLRRIAAKPTA